MYMYMYVYVHIYVYICIYIYIYISTLKKEERKGEILVLITFHYLQIYLAEVEYCSEYFHMTKFIRARNVQTLCNIKAKP